MHSDYTSRARLLYSKQAITSLNVIAKSTGRIRRLNQNDTDIKGEKLNLNFSRLTGRNKFNSR